MVSNNPAGRLYHFMQLIRTKGESLGGHPTRKAWSQLLRIEMDNIVGLSQTITKIAALPLEVETAIRSLDDVKHNVYLSWTKDLAEALNHPDQSRQFHILISAANDNVLSLIAICDEMLSRLSPEHRVDESKLVQLRDQVRGLRDKFNTDEELSTHLKAYVDRYLDLIEQAIVDYELFGLHEYEAGVERAVGHYILSKEAFSQVENTKHGPEFRMALAALVVALVSAYPSAKQLGVDIQQLLPSMPDVVEVNTSK